mgnify:CR=1 FL=1
MVIGIIGESCTGKSTLADKLKSLLGAEVYTGKDYLRLAKNETIAKKMFSNMLIDAIDGENIIYVISEREHMSFIPEGAVRVLVTAELDVIKSRFSARMGGVLPKPVEMMLEKKHGCFDRERCDIHMKSGVNSPEEIIRQIKAIER